QAVAPYFTDYNNDGSTPGMTLDQLFSDLEQDLTTSVIPAFQHDAALDAQYGVPMIAYEGGQGLWPGENNPNYNWLPLAPPDPRMALLYPQMLHAWQQAGGGVFDAFQPTGIPSPSGFWGMLPNVTATGSPIYNALVEYAYPMGDANTDGTVDFGDF